MRQAIVTRYVSPTNTRGARIKATCDRGSITIGYPHHARMGEAAHSVAVRALLAKFQVEDGTNKCWPAIENWVCGGLPQANKDCFVWVQLPNLYRFTFIGRPIGAIGVTWEHTVERFGDSEESARQSLWNNCEHISVTASELVLP